jgi:hypothetical protein
MVLKAFSEDLVTLEISQQSLSLDREFLSVESIDYLHLLTEIKIFLYLNNIKKQKFNI